MGEREGRELEWIDHMARRLVAARIVDYPSAALFASSLFDEIYGAKVEPLAMLARNRIVEAEDCDKCGAQVGEACRGRRGGEILGVHIVKRPPISTSGDLTDDEWRDVELRARLAREAGGIYDK